MLSFQQQDFLLGGPVFFPFAAFVFRGEGGNRLVHSLACDFEPALKVISNTFVPILFPSTASIVAAVVVSVSGQRLLLLHRAKHRG